ncbi:MAG: hypothetical protein Q8O76_04140, partial [Chloroflexota bacterium]|nr:hypothetical protein [Chloroflexota bacterium]
GTSWLIVLSLASLGHLAMDEMWQQPGTLFWPFLGWRFRVVSIEDWTFSLLLSMGNLKVLVSELIGMAIILALAIRGLLARRS